MGTRHEDCVAVICVHSAFRMPIAEHAIIWVIFRRHMHTIIHFLLPSLLLFFSASIYRQRNEIRAITIVIYVILPIKCTALNA